MSGFAWNPMTEMWSAEPEVWKQLIEANPKAQEWMNKRIRNYAKLAELYGQDRATCQCSEDPIEIANRRRNNTDVNPVFNNTIDEIDFRISQNDIRLENVREYENIDDDIDIGAVRGRKHRSTSEPPGSTKSKKAKMSNNDDGGFIILSNSMDKMANAMKESSEMMTNAILAKNTTSNYDVWALLEEMGLESNLIARAYVFLAKNPNMVDALLKCPIHQRKHVLLEMM
ncbi:uncharacterized protein [Euphorbia lathyris]|uniref:uncharacterized protein n=1 Tax=Euphorbia lathyris TaxID=212925 RepID=UPI0033134AC9